MRANAVDARDLSRDALCRRRDKAGDPITNIRLRKHPAVENMQPRHLLPIALSVAVMACSESESEALPAQAAPDFTGVWQAYATVAEPGTGSPSTAEGRELVAAFSAQFGDDMPEAGWYCVPPGMPRTVTTTVSYPVEIVQSEGRITMLFEYDMQQRRIFMDGREFPAENYWRSRMGYSIAEFEDETLVIETRLLNEFLDGQWPRTEGMRIVERLWRANRDEMNVVRNGFPEENDSNDLLVWEMTVTDDVLYAEPQQITVYYQRLPDAEFLEYDCVVSLWEEALEEARD